MHVRRSAIGCVAAWSRHQMPGLKVGRGDDAARFYAAEAAKVIQAFFHAAALTGRTIDHVLLWVAHPAVASEPTEILREHPHAAPSWHGLLQGALYRVALRNDVAEAVNGTRMRIRV